MKILKWPWFSKQSSSSVPRERPTTTTLNTEILNEYVQDVDVAMSKALSALATHDYFVKRKSLHKGEHFVAIAHKHLRDAKDAMHELKKYVSGEDSP